jgi:UDP-N-acetylglucosamine--N-acetylmuramyl-(pentapeptide) pyrophosphoryl-undecaprenol N-acetylglucosamine transferase
MAHKYIAYAAGKSGGHIIPCQTLFIRYQSEHPEVRALFFTTNAPLDNTILPDSTPDMVLCRLPLASRIKNPLRFFSLCSGLMVSLWVSLFYLLKYRPMRLVTTGGITAIPVCIAAFLLRIPIDLYELNAVVGKATRFLSPLVTRIMICFSEAQRSFRSKACTLTQYPIRFSVTEPLDRESTKNSLKLHQGIPTLLVLGGSQGSLQLNTLVKQALAQYAKPIQIIHQTGGNDTFDWASWYEAQKHNAIVFSYHDMLAPYIIAADVIICRAGAGTLFECMAYRKKMIIIPLEGVADNHQVANAYACQRNYQDVITLRQERLNNHSSLLIGTVDTLLYPPSHLSSSIHEHIHTIR